MDDNTSSSRVRRRGSIFWPLLLVVIGVLLLFGNLGILTEGTWNVLWNYWPILLVLMGLDGIYRNEGLVGSAFISGLGVVFLLSNLGYLATDAFGLIIRLWPILLIAIGFDIIVGRRSVFASLLGLVLVLIVLVGAIFLMEVGVGANQVELSRTLQVNLENASTGVINLKPGTGKLEVQGGTEDGMLIQGSVPQADTDNYTQEVSFRGEQVDLKLENPAAIFVRNPGSFERWTWSINLTEAIPLDLNIDMGAGRVNADLEQVLLNQLQVDLGVGTAFLELPTTGSYSVQVDGGIGRIQIDVPEATGVRIEADTGLVIVNMPDSYRRQGDLYLSPDYESSEQKVQIRIDLGIGTVEVNEI